MTVTTIKSDDARSKWRELLDTVFVNRDEAVVIERYAKPLAVLINYDTWQERRFTQREVQALLMAKEIELRGEPTISSEEHRARMQERYGNVTSPIQPGSK